MFSFFIFSSVVHPDYLVVPAVTLFDTPANSILIFITSDGFGCTLPRHC